MIRPYQAGDYQNIIDLFLLNTPQYFAPEEIVVRTSQHTWQFFEKTGFELQKTGKDF